MEDSTILKTSEIRIVDNNAMNSKPVVPFLQGARSKHQPTKKTALLSPFLERAHQSTKDPTGNYYSRTEETKTLTSITTFFSPMNKRKRESAEKRLEEEGKRSNPQRT